MFIIVCEGQLMYFNPNIHLELFQNNCHFVVSFENIYIYHMLRDFYDINLYYTYSDIKKIVYKTPKHYQYKDCYISKIYIQMKHFQMIHIYYIYT